MEESPIALRIKTIIETLRLTDSQFADRCGISRPTLSLILSGKNKKISDVMITQIHDTFPDISIMWLLFGEGEIFKNSKTEEKNLFSDDEISKFPSNNREEDEQLNLVNLKQIEKVVQDVVNKSFESSIQSLEKMVLKIQEPQNLRKVNKITVYYDDSTFETFTPEHF